MPVENEQQLWVRKVKSS